MRIVRWKAVVPLSLLVGLVLAVWWLMLDRVAERAVESVGTAIVGARVDLAGADVRVGEGAVVLRGLQVTNPNAPMTNLVEASEIVADLALAPLLERKIVVESLVVRGVRFGTPRERSGALDHPDPESGRILREVEAWAGRIRIPPLTVEGLANVVDFGRLSPDSLRTLALARSLAGRAGALPDLWGQRVAAIDPRPRLDSARALVARLREANPLRLGPQGIRSLVTGSEQTLQVLGGLGRSLATLDSSARGEVADLQGELRRLEDARAADFAYARGLLRLPSLTGPDVSTAVFGEALIAWIKPALYWLKVAETYLPPGLDPRRRPGPRRARMAGFDVEFPGRAQYPRFLLERGIVGLELGGAGVAAGQYAAVIEGLTSEPTLYGRPLRIRAERTAAARGPASVTVAAVLDHVGAPLRDSVAAVVGGIALPSFALPVIGARVALGQGSTELALRRIGEQLDARWVWRAPFAEWSREAGAVGAAAAPPALGTRAWLEDLAWRAVSQVRKVEIEVRLSGSVAAPALAVQSNVGEVIAQELRRALGDEVERAERRVRAEMERLVGAEVGRARAAVAGLAQDVEDRIGVPLAEVRRLEGELQAELRRLTGGIRIP